jgi:K+ transporter
LICVKAATQGRRGRIEARYGFMERPNVLAILNDCRTKGVEITRDDVIFYIGHSPRRGGRKALDAWEKKQQIAFEKDWAAFKHLAKVVPTNADGAISIISAFLDHSMSQDTDCGEAHREAP